MDPLRIQNLFLHIKPLWSSILKNPPTVESKDYDILKHLNLDKLNNISLWGQKFIWLVAPLAALTIGIKYYPYFYKKINNRFSSLKNQLKILIDKLSSPTRFPDYQNQINYQIEKINKILKNIHSRNSQIKKFKKEFKKEFDNILLFVKKN